jgi:secondary thiamine-phosphate synthase enzyme
VVKQETFSVSTRGRGFESLTERVATFLTKSGVTRGLCNVFTRHTSASLLITENADGAVRRDLERFMQRIAPDGSSEYEHDAEGPDDMPAHIRSVLTNATLTVPIEGGELQLGTWQGIYLWEHRHGGQRREVIVTVIGD